MEKLARLAVEKIESYKSNEIIMGYVLSEARKQVALDGAARVGSILSEADIELLECTNDAVRIMVDGYVQAALTRVTNQIRQTTTSSTELAEVTNRLISISQGSNQTLEGTASLYTRFRLSVDEAKVSSERLLGVVDTISKSLSISGATAADFGIFMKSLGLEINGK